MIKEMASAKQPRDRRLAFIAGQALILYVLITLAGYPGQMSWDSFYALREARTWVNGGGFPPFHAYLWRLFDHIWQGPALLWMFQNAVYIFSVAAIVGYVTSRRSLSLLLTVIVGSLPVFGILITVWKDVATAAFFAACVASAFALENAEHKAARRNFYLAGLVMLWLGSLSRLNALPAAIPLLWVLNHLYFGRTASKYLRVFLVQILVLVASVYYVSSFKFLTFERLIALDPWIRNPIVVTAAYDVFGISRHANVDIYGEDGTKILTAECAHKAFDPTGISATLKRLASCGGQDEAIFVKAIALDVMRPVWLTYVAANPVAYLKTRADFTSKLIGIGSGVPYQPTLINTPDPRQIYLPPRIGDGSTNNIDWGHGVGPRRIASLAEFYVYCASMLSLRAWVIYLIGFLSLLFSVRRVVSPVSRALLVSGVVYFMPLTLIAVDSGVRYNLWPITACLLFILTCIDAFFEKDGKSPGSRV